MLGRAHHVVIDCPEPHGLAAFYSELLGLPITYESNDFVVVAGSTHASGYAFQRAPDHQAPRWPDPAYPQQLHLDVMVDDLIEADEEVVKLGAARLAAATMSMRTRRVIRSASSQGRTGHHRSNGVLLECEVKRPERQSGSLLTAP